MTFYGTTATGSRLDRAEAVRGACRRGRLQEGAHRRRALQVRLVHAGRRAGPRGLRRLLAQGAQRETGRAEEHSRRDHARGGPQARRRRRRLQLRGASRRRDPSNIGAEAHHPAHQHRLLPRLHRSVGSQVAMGRPAGTAGRQPGRRSQGHQRRRLPGFAGLTNSVVARHMEFALPLDPPAFDRGAGQEAAGRGRLSQRVRRRRFHAEPAVLLDGRGHRHQSERGRHPHAHAHVRAGGIPHLLA